MADPATLEAGADVVALAEPAALLGDDAAVGEVLEDSSSFEQAVTPPTAIVAAIGSKQFMFHRFLLRHVTRGPRTCQEV
jgi:hypothetical protein